MAAVVCGRILGSAPAEAEVSTATTRHCKRCKVKTVNGLKCQSCDNVFHPSCAKWSNYVQFISDEVIVCCAEKIDVSQEQDEVISPEDKVNNRLLNYVLEQKDIIINELRNEINLLKDKIKLMEEIDYLQSINANFCNNRHNDLINNNSNIRSDPNNKVTSRNADINCSTRDKLVTDDNKNEGAHDGSGSTTSVNDIGACVNLPSASSRQAVATPALYSDIASNSKSNKVKSVKINNPILDDVVSRPTVQDFNEPNDSSEKWNVVSHIRTSKKTNDSVKRGGSKHKHNFITGSSDKNTLGTVEKLCFLFVSRLNPNMETNSVLDYLKEFKPAEYQVEKLSTKFPTYSSFKVGIPISLYDEIYLSDFWPLGTFISKYRFPKNTLNYKDASTKDRT